MQYQRRSRFCWRARVQAVWRSPRRSTPGSIEGFGVPSAISAPSVIHGIRLSHFLNSASSGDSCRPSRDAARRSSARIDRRELLIS